MSKMQIGGGGSPEKRGASGRFAFQTGIEQQISRRVRSIVIEPPEVKIQTQKQEPLLSRDLLPTSPSGGQEAPIVEIPTQKAGGGEPPKPPDDGPQGFADMPDPEPLSPEEKREVRKKFNTTVDLLFSKWNLFVDSISTPGVEILNLALMTDTHEQRVTLQRSKDGHSIKRTIFLTEIDNNAYKLEAQLESPPGTSPHVAHIQRPGECIVHKIEADNEGTIREETTDVWVKGYENANQRLFIFNLKEDETKGLTHEQIIERLKEQLAAKQRDEELNRKFDEEYNAPVPVRRGRLEEVLILAERAEVPIVLFDELFEPLDQLVTNKRNARAQESQEAARAFNEYFDKVVASLGLPTNGDMEWNTQKISGDESEALRVTVERRGDTQILAFQADKENVYRDAVFFTQGEYFGGLTRLSLETHEGFNSVSDGIVYLGHFLPGGPGDQISTTSLIRNFMKNPFHFKNPLNFTD